jgi:PAS domain S-box-containing protein
MNWKVWTTTKTDAPKIWWIILIYLAIYIILSILRGMLGAFYIGLGQVWLLLGHLMTGWVIYYAIKHISDHAVRRSWWFIFLAVICFSIGSIIRIAFRWINFSTPIGFSQGDFVFILGMPLFWIGLLRFPYQPRVKVTRIRSLFDFILSVISFTILVVAIMYAPVSSIFHGEMWKAASFLIVFMDVISIVLLIFIFLVGDVRNISLARGWMVGGIAAYTISNLFYAFGSIGTGYNSGGVDDLGRIVGNTFVMMAILTDVFKPFNWPPRLTRIVQGILFRLQTYFPLIMGFMLSWFVFFDSQINMLAFWGTVVIALGLIARQGLQIGEDEMQKYADLVNRIAEPTFICDSKGDFQLVNPALVELAAYPVGSELKGHSVYGLFTPFNEIKDLLDTGLEQGWSGEIKLQRTDNSQIPVSLSLRPLSSDLSGRLAIAGSAHDLTAQKQQQLALQQAYEQITIDRSELEKMNVQLEKMVAEKTKDLLEAYSQLEEQNRTLQQLDRMKSDFVGLVSHELRAPLTNIRGGIELLQRIRNLPGSAAETMQLVGAETQRLTRFVESILDLTALDAGRMPFYPAPLVLQSVMPVLKQLLTYLPGAERVVWNVPDQLPFVMADDQALTSVIFHLIDNAIKYASEGKIDITAGVDHGRLRVQVQDEGQGIEPEALPQLFQRFYRASSDSQVVYGHGLGLYIVKRMLEAMNGEIEARNNPDGGACFTFWLPLVDEKEVRDAQIAAGG